MVIGNKSDLESQREVELAEAESLCEYVPELLYVIETSAKENKNIDDAFACLATELKVRESNCKIGLSRKKPFNSDFQRRFDCLNIDMDSAITLGQGKPVKECSGCNLT